MGEPMTEVIWKASGCRCEIRVMPAGYRCGYVAVKKGHPLYGVGYNDVPEALHAAVNGGLTYSEQEGDEWVFGFDFAHWWDNDSPYLSSYVADDLRDYHQWRLDNPYPGGRIPTLRDAVSDCEALAAKLRRCNPLRHRLKGLLKAFAQKLRG